MGASSADVKPQDFSLPRLKAAISWSRWKMQVFREIRLMFLKEYAGSLYGEQLDITRRKVPYNLLATDVDTYSRALIATNPQLLITTFDPAKRGEVTLLETATNRRLFEIRWWDQLEEAAMGAIFCMAAAKIGVEEVKGKKIDPASGEPVTEFSSYVDIIDFDDLIIDMSANKFSEIAYIGHRFRKSIEEMKANPKYKFTAADAQPSPRSSKNERGDPKVSTVTNNDINEDAEPQDMGDFAEIYIPSQRRLITCTYDQGELGTTPLCDEDYEGPPHGPYELLGLGKIPGNLIPLSPVAQLFDLHDAVNHITSKIIRDAENHKRFNVAQKGNTDDAVTLKNEINGGFAFLSNPGSVTTMEVRGVNKADVAVLMQLMDMQNKQAGNVDVLGGLQSDAGTLGQENLLVGNSSKKILSMQEKMQEFVTRIGRAIAWHVWHQAKLGRVAVPHKLGGFLDSIEPLTPQAEFDEYDFKVNPYSMQDTTPAKQLQKIDATVTNVVVPMAPILASQNLMFDMRAYMAVKAKYENTPEYSQFIVDAPPQQMQQQGDEGQQQNPGQGLKQGPSKPPSTTRTYQRISRGGAQAGKQHAMASMLSEAA